MIKCVVAILTLGSFITGAKAYHASAESGGLTFYLTAYKKTPIMVTWLGKPESENAPRQFLDITVYVANHSETAIQFPMGLSFGETITYPGYIVEGELKMIVDQGDLPWAEDVSTKPSVGQVDPTILLPGETAQIDERRMPYIEGNPWKGVKIDLEVYDNLRQFYPVWTGRVSLEIDLTQDEVEDLCEE